MNRTVLMLLARRGHAVQETLPVIDALRAAGIAVVPGTESGGDVRFDPLCIALAFGESLWAPSWRLHRAALKRGELSSVPRPGAHVKDWVDRFDAIVVPGGHGSVYGAFATGPVVADAIHRFAAAGKPVGLICHSVGAAAYLGPDGQAPLAEGRRVTCWPRAMERALSSLPWAGAYFLPFGRPVQDLLEEVSPRVECSALPWRMPHVVVDGPLVTAWGPWSGAAFAGALSRELAHGQSTRLRDVS